MARILVVEDELFIAWELEKTLVEGGFDVLGPAQSVERALELLQTTRPDAAVLDVNLGGEWVVPVVEILNAMGVPFVLATGYQPSDLQRSPILQSAVNVGKPTSTKRLLTELNRLLS